MEIKHVQVVHDRSHGDTLPAVVSIAMGEQEKGVEGVR